MIAAVLTLVLIALAKGAWPRAPNEQQIRALVHGMPIAVHTYRPPACRKPSVLFVFHELGRKASRIRDNAKALADSTCLIVLAPLFDRERFPNWRYHRAGVVRHDRVQPRGLWTGPIIDALIDWGRRWAGDPAMPYSLFGHSAGGQFLSRLSAYSPPSGAARIVIANPSVHVLPDLLEPAPYGMGVVFSGDDADARLEAYLALPITIYLRDEDTGEKNLVKNEGASRQGTNRFERGRYAFHAGRRLAQEKGGLFHWRLVIAPGVGHSSRGMLKPPSAASAFGLGERG